MPLVSLQNGYRRVGVKVTGSSSPWFTFTNQGELDNVRQALDNYGIGYDNLFYNTSISANPWAFAFTVIVIAPNEQSDDQVENIVLQAVSSVIGNATASIVSSEAANAQNASTLDAITKATADLAKAGVTGATSNIGTPLAIGAVAILLLLLYAPRR